MRISLVVAMDEHRLIGAGNRLPWHLPADLSHFRRLTRGKPILMGRHTYESIGRPLPGRHNIVMTRNPSYTAPGCTLAASPEAALRVAGQAREVMVIGGALVYRDMLPWAQRIYLTLIHGTFRGDAWFPPLDPEIWIESGREDYAAHARNPYSYSFVRLINKGEAGPPHTTYSQSMR